MTNCRNIIFEDCLHMVLCNECFQVLEKQECPVCKHEITQVKNVYNLAN